LVKVYFKTRLNVGPQTEGTKLMNQFSFRKPLISAAWDIVFSLFSFSLNSPKDSTSPRIEYQMSMKIQYVSDLHLEFPANKEFLKQHPLRSVGDILVLVGDIVPFAVMEKHPDFFSFLADNFRTTYWLPGNHEYYHFDIAEKIGSLYETIRSNVFLVNNCSVIHENLKLVFSTLWSRISPANQWQIERSLNDFHLIKHKGFRFSAEEYNLLHAESLTYVENELDAHSEKQVVVFTHHCPTFLNYPEQYRGNVLNEAFAVELHDLIETSNIACWVYGHHHTNTPAFKIGNTVLMTNQLGYVQRNEHQLFEGNKVIEI
jgi:predicted phosphohydrolase